jgi:hypothetical protein
MQERNRESTQPCFSGQKKKKLTIRYSLKEKKIRQLDTVGKKLIRAVAMIAKANMAAHHKTK